jgi:hypothetical protein
LSIGEGALKAVIIAAALAFLGVFIAVGMPPFGEFRGQYTF